MKKIILLAILFIMAYLPLKSQNLFYETGLYDNYDYYWNQNCSGMYFYGIWYMVGSREQKTIKEININKYEHSFYKYKRGKKAKNPAHKTIASFDKNFNLISKEYYNNKNKLTKKYEYEFKHHQGCFTDFKFFRKNKLIKHEIIEYNDSNKVVKYSYLKKDDKKKIRTTIIKYDESKKREIAKDYLDKNGKITRRWEYEYYDGNERKETKYYKKGKLKHIWIYSCDDQGKEYKKNVNTERICKVKEYLNDSTYIVINRTTDKKGKIRKNVTHYRNDNKLLSFMSYNNKGKLISGYYYNYDCKNRVIEQTYYKRNYKIRRKEQKFYNIFDLHEKTIIYKNKGKIKQYIEYKYNYNKQLIEKNYYNKNHKLSKTFKYEYNNKGHIVKTIVLKKDKTIKEYNTVFYYN